MRDLVEDLYRQNEWANLVIVEVCRGLSDQQLEATAAGAFGSIRSTLTHLVAAEAQNVRRLGATPRRELVGRGQGWPSFDTLEEVVRSSAEGLIERARAVANSTVVVDEAPGVRYEIEANVLLLQVLNHSTDHRSQICTILTELDALPQTGDDGQTIVDGWAWSDALGLARRVD